MEAGGGQGLEHRSPSSGHAKMTATNGELQRGAGGVPGTEHRCGGGSTSSGHAKMTATNVELQRGAGGGPAPEHPCGEGAGVGAGGGQGLEHRCGEGAGVGAGVEREAVAEASEEIKEGVTEVEVETGGRLISRLLQREEKALIGDQIVATSPETIVV